LRFVASVTILALASAACSARPQPLPNTDLPDANGIRIRAASSGSNDNWPTFAYNYARTGFNPSVTNLTRSSVPKLGLRWKVNLGDEIFSSPVIYDGNLIVVSEGSKASSQPGSVVYDLSTADGHVIWQYAMGALAQMTPTIDPDAGLVIVANEERTHRNTNPSHVTALSLLDGSLVWSTPVYAPMRAAPVVAGGSVYFGRAGGDPPGCFQGGVSALNESTGDVEWNWNVDPKPHNGGAVWGAIAYDGTHLTFGTGNTCNTMTPTANGAVSLDLSGNVVWSMVAVKDSRYDADTGGGTMLFNGRAHFINKNGMLYSLNDETGHIDWSTVLNPYSEAPTWSGGFTTPTTDGATMIEGSGLYKNAAPKDGGGEFCMLAAVRPAEVFSGYHSMVQGVNLSGRVLWGRTMKNRLVGYVALVPGIGFIGLNQDFVALNLKNGKTLWSYATPAYIDASMVVVPSGVYGADDGGNVYAFALQSSNSRRQGNR
jgi:hypothetical protein